MTPDEQRDLAYPLHWPAGHPRTRRTDESAFKVRSFAVARNELLDELRLMGTKYPVISTNITLRRDGLPYANQAQPDDRGVAVYFLYKNASHVFACDRWDKVHDNIRAVARTINAIRGIARWGTTDMMERAFTAFAALPASAEDWRTVLGLGPNATLEQCKAAHRKLAVEHHPDRGGRADEMVKVNAAYDNAQRELDPTP